MPPQRRCAKGAAILFIALGAGGALAGADCGSSNVTGPTPPPPSPSPPPPPGQPNCHALNYPGATGGARIQNAIDDASCSTVYIHPDGPDGGVWLIDRTLTLRSNQTLTTADEARRPTLRAAAVIRLMAAERVTDVTLRRLTLDGARSGLTGVLVVASARVEFTQGRITRMRQFGIVVRDLPPSSAIRINRSAFEDNGFIDVRTQTNDRNAFHSQITVEDNTMHGTTYGVAFANCGGTSGAACVARNNQMKPKRSDPGTGLDLNRSHHAIVTGNRVLGLGDTCAPGVTCRCGYGFTIDDTQNATITGNTVEGCTQEGIVLGNGAVPENRPWYVSGNMIADNTVRCNGGLGLGAFRNENDPMDNNMFNVFRNNRIEGNAAGGCASNGISNSFFGNGPQACLPQGAPATLRRWLERRRSF